MARSAPTAWRASAPDGYTLLAATAGTHVTAVHLMKSLPYDPIKDFTPIIAAVEPVTCLAVTASLPVNSVPELIAYAKAHPDELSFGSSGVGSVFHLMGELFNETAGVKIKHVPYRGVAPAMQDVIGGHIPMVFISVANADAAAKAGQVKILAVLEPERYSKLPNVPSMSGDHPGVPQAVVVVRILRTAGPAAADRRRASIPRWRRRSTHRMWCRISRPTATRRSAERRSNSPTC